jgi:hypothetical protein
VKPVASRLLRNCLWDMQLGMQLGMQTEDEDEDEDAESLGFLPVE